MIVNGLQATTIALYEGIVNGRDLDGLKFNSLGYKPIWDITSTTINNNARTVEVDLHGNGLKEFAKIYASSLFRLLPFKANLSKSEQVDGFISMQIKSRTRNFLEEN